MKYKAFKLLSFVCTMVIMMLPFANVFAKAYIPTANPNIGDGSSAGKFQGSFANAIGSLLWIGYAIAIGMLIFVGIKYVIASADERASIKGMFVKIVIGSVIIALSTTIVNIVLNVATSTPK